MKKYWLFVVTTILVTAVLAGCTTTTPKTTETNQAISPSSATNPNVTQLPNTSAPSTSTSQTQTQNQGGSQTTKTPKIDNSQTSTQGDNIRPIPGSAPRDTGKTVTQQVGLIQNSNQASAGYTLLAPKHYTTTYLIDNAGKVVNSWESKYLPGQSVYLLENGHLLRSCFTKNQAFIGGGEGGGVEEYDWEGNLVWEFWYSSDKYLMHHDIKPLPNGNVLALVVRDRQVDIAVAVQIARD